MATDPTQEKFVDTAGHWLELFDKDLASQGEPIHSRPLKSAFLFVQHAILEVHGGTTEQFYTQDWFAYLVGHIRKWYADRYGAAALKGPADLLGGIVLVHDTPLRLAIPVTAKRVEVEGETSWMIFPDSVHETERIESFFSAKPNLARLTPAERTAVEERIKEIVRWTRSTHLALRFAADLSDEFMQMAGTTWSHFDKAIEDLLTLREERAAVAVWEMHLAVEKCFKLLLAQNGRPMTGHKLEELAKTAADEGWLSMPSQISKMPAWALVNKYRYSEASIAVSAAIENYFNALQVAHDVTSKLRRSLSGSNMAFLLKRPKWVGPD